MKIVALLFCLIGTSCSIPILPRRIFSASASNELLLALSLSNAGLLPPQLQGATVGRLIPGILQQPQIPGLAQVGFGPRGPFVGQLPNQLAFSGQGLQPQAPGQGAQQTQQAQQQDPNNPQMPQQNGQPNQVMPYMVFPQGQGQGQMVQYYPFYMYPQQQQPPQQAPQQPGQQQPTDQNTPFINQRGFVPQQAAPVVPGAQQQQQQQQMPNDPSAGGALTTQIMPFGGVMPQFHGDRMHFANGGLMLPTTTAAPSADALASSPEPTGDANYMKDKASFNPFMEP